MQIPWAWSSVLGIQWVGFALCLVQFWHCRLSTIHICNVLPLPIWLFDEQSNISCCDHERDGESNSMGLDLFLVGESVSKTAKGKFWLIGGYQKQRQGGFHPDILHNAAFAIGHEWRRLFTKIFQNRYWNFCFDFCWLFWVYGAAGGSFSNRPPCLAMHLSRRDWNK